jgi:peptidoglycan/LPS O-acetylase OafA/YrhL
MSSHLGPIIGQESAVTIRHKYGALLGLRFIASILIVLDHFHYTFWKTSVLPNFVVAVSFFFMLSGFGLTHAYSEKEAPKTGRFALRRLFRLWPLHLTTLLITAVFLPKVTVTTWKLSEAPLILLANALLVHGWVPIRAWFFSFNIGSWSMSMLLACYLGFPTLLRGLRSPRGRWLLCLLFIGLLGLMMAVSAPCPLYAETRISQQGLLYISPLSRGFEFFLGMLAANLLLNPDLVSRNISQPLNTFFQSPWRATVLELVVLIFLVGMLLFSQDERVLLHQIPFLSKNVAYYASFSGLTLLPCLLTLMIFSQECGFLSRLLASRIMQTFGGLTFGIYLWHLPLLHLYLYPVALKPHIPQPTPLMLVLYFAGLLLLSAVSAHYLEKPVYRWVARRLVA